MMPYYEYRCENGHQFSVFLSVIAHAPVWNCRLCELVAVQIIGAPLLVKASADVCYDSPIDGKPITNWQARQEDLKRSGCRPYDDGMKQDYHRHILESESALDTMVDASVEEAIEKMPTSKRGKLFSELVDQGTTAETVRSTPHAG